MPYEQRVMLLLNTGSLFPTLTVPKFSSSIPLRKTAWWTIF